MIQTPKGGSFIQLHLETQLYRQLTEQGKLVFNESFMLTETALLISLIGRLSLSLPEKYY